VVSSAYDLADFIRPRQIVVASDLRDGSILLPRAGAQALQSGASVTLVHALRSNLAGAYDADEPRERDRAEQTLDGMRRALEVSGIECTVLIERGLPAEIINRRIAEGRAGRLLVAAHGRQASGQTLLGGVANALLLTSRVPVCVIGPQTSVSSARAQPRKILHPIVLQGRFRENAHLAAGIASVCQAGLTLLHLTPPSDAPGRYANLIESTLRNSLDALAWPPGVEVRTLCQYGEPVAGILQTAAAERADLIIMSIQRDYPWWSMRNNHAYRVIAEAACPVLTFHERIWGDVCSPPIELPTTA
jgi:nucleotide-binding universal stress UspA family protein